MGTIGLGCRLGWKWVLRRPNSGKPLQWCWHEGGIWLWSRDQANCLSTSGPLDINHILDDIGSKSAFQYTMFIVQGHVKRFRIQFLRKYFKRDVHWSVIFPSTIRQPFYSDRVAQVAVGWLAANEDFFFIFEDWGLWNCFAPKTLMYGIFVMNVAKNTTYVFRGQNFEKTC